MKQALQQGFSSRSRSLLQNLGLSKAISCFDFFRRSRPNATESYVITTVIRWIYVAICAAKVKTAVKPRSASHHLSYSFFGTRGISCRTILVVIRCIPVIAPLVYIAGHFVNTVSIGFVASLPTVHKPGRQSIRSP